MAPLPAPPPPISHVTNHALVRYLLLDLNSFFASCEQQDHPSLRGQPLAIVPLLTDRTCAIAASIEAKRFGIKTGMGITEAKQRCPQLKLVQARHRRYVEYHHQIVAAVERHLPISQVLSIDEMVCTLMGRERAVPVATQLANTIKAEIAKSVGERLTCSVGLAPNRLLAKLASDMQKPNGLTVLRPCDLPTKILALPLQDICGIGPRMAARLAAHGIIDMPALWGASAATLRRVWGGIEGERFYAALHGEDLPSQPTTRRSISHQHVLEPELRNIAGMRSYARHLLAKAAFRLRQDNLTTTRLTLLIKWIDGARPIASQPMTSRLPACRSEDALALPATADTLLLLRALDALLGRLPQLPRSFKPLRVAVVLGPVAPAAAAQADLFATLEPAATRQAQLSPALDALNVKYGSGTVSFGLPPTRVRDFGIRIAFQRIPSLLE